jgi:hypothetical protein
MGSAASVDRLYKQSRSKKRKARWPRKFKRAIEEYRQEIKDIHKNAEEQINAALAREAEVVRDYADLQDTLREFKRNQPAATEWTDIKKRWFGARWWWALWRGLKGRMRFERG